MSDPSFAVTDRTRIRRRSERGTHDVAAVNAILDGGFVCHIGFAVEGRPWVFPTTYARVDDVVYVHGAVGNFGLRSLASGLDVCLTVTLVDGIVLAKSAFHHSINYRSVMLFGRAEVVRDDGEKAMAMASLVDHVVPGRAADCRPPAPAELTQTLILRLAIAEVSAKTRTGGPVDDDDDLALPYWSGHLPLPNAPSEPVPSEAATGPAPAYVTQWRRPRSS